MKIEFDIALMTQTQREALAGVILAFPEGDKRNDQPAPKLKPATNIGEELARETAAENTALAREQHGADDPAKVFGGAQSAAPLVPPAPSTVDAAPAPIAPGTPPAAPPPPGTNPPAPAPAPPGSAPSAPAAPLNPVAAVELDKTGLPWDHRIHAGSKAKNKDDTWRLKPKLDATVKAGVEAELRALMAAPGGTPNPFASSAPGAPASAAAASANVQGAAGAAPSATVPPDARPQYLALVGRASAAIHAHKVTQAEISATCMTFGVPALPLLANRLDLVVEVAAAIDAMIAAKG